MCNKWTNFVNLFQNLVHYRPPSQGSSPCPSLQNFPGPGQAGSGPNNTTNSQSYSTNTMEADNNEYMKSALCQQIKEENGHNSG